MKFFFLFFLLRLTLSFFSSSSSLAAYSPVFRFFFRRLRAPPSKMFRLAVFAVLCECVVFLFFTGGEKGRKGREAVVAEALARCLCRRRPQSAKPSRLVISLSLFPKPCSALSFRVSRAFWDHA